MTNALLSTLRFAALVLGLCTAAAASAEQVSVRLDTGSLSGKGWLDLQFNPGPNATAPASATLSAFAGALDGAADTTGSVAGALPGTVVFLNGTPYNDLFQPVSLGSMFSFQLAFAGDYLADGFDSGSVFVVSLYGADGASALGNPDPLTNGLLAISLMPASLNGLTIVVSDAALAAASVGESTPGMPVPEPTSILLILAGGAAFASAIRCRREKAVDRGGR